VYVGGEALPRDIADRWAPGRHLENGYGPTECAVTALRTRIHEHELITIGTPVRGNHALVLDEDGSEIDDDSPGELCLSGIGVARGYLNRPELTAAKFPEHPRHGRIYRTGDLVRRDGDSRFLYLGRIDAQVKLRGFRIELTAIESLLAAQPGVRAAACTVQEESAGPILVAHVVPVEAGAPDRHEEWRASLGRELPAHMVPARIALVAELPVTVGGKLDRARLPRVDARAPAASRTIVQARNDVERAVRDAFRSALGLAADPSTDDDFFVDLGGDS
jgi:acyl-coenzyme A synthetase/AMP-(fatty) acid ligase